MAYCPTVYNLLTTTAFIYDVYDLCVVVCGRLRLSLCPFY